MENTNYFPTIRQLADYEIWCNTLAIDAAAQLDPTELFQTFQFGLGTIHRTLFHTLNVLRYWSAFVGPTIIRPADVAYNPIATISEMKHWDAALSSAFLSAIDQSHAAGLLGNDRRLVQVFHLVTHGTHHRTQFITMLRLLGKDPPFEAGDFAGWQRERQALV